MARDNVKMAVNANRRFSGFTCYAALAEHKASNIEEVSYQILLGKDKYFVSTDGGGGEAAGERARKCYRWLHSKTKPVTRRSGSPSSESPPAG